MREPLRSYSLIAKRIRSRAKSETGYDQIGANVVTLPRIGAKKIPAGTYLPTVREYSAEAANYGAKGILEISQTSSQPDGYTYVYGINASGQKDIFYYDPDGYLSPAAELDAWFWTSSVFGIITQASYVMDGSSGNLLQDARGDSEAIRCFPNLGTHPK